VGATVVACGCPIESESWIRQRPFLIKTACSSVPSIAKLLTRQQVSLVVARKQVPHPLRRHPLSPAPRDARPNPGSHEPQGKGDGLRAALTSVPSVNTESSLLEGWQRKRTTSLLPGSILWRVFEANMISREGILLCNYASTDAAQWTSVQSIARPDPWHCARPIRSWSEKLPARSISFCSMIRLCSIWSGRAPPTLRKF
jgi:hypothetical protein